MPTHWVDRGSGHLAAEPRTATGTFPRAVSPCSHLTAVFLLGSRVLLPPCGRERACV